VDENGDNVYMAPEVLHAGVRLESDVFSLGISVFEIITGTDCILPRI
jgi:serine/threonine protein kinase